MTPTPVKIVTDPDLGAFTAEAEAFLSAHAGPRPPASENGRGGGSDRVWLFAEPPPEEEQALLEAARDWRRAVFDAGFGWITGPPEYGGRGLPLPYERAWQQLERRYDTPGRGPFNIGVGMVAPTILAHGSETAKARYLAALHRGDVIGCQLFSEPGVGSDLASVATTAVADGEGWRVNGQKVWTSGAHYSDIGLLLTRTATGPRHGNLSAFVVDMHASGVEVRPLRQMTGDAAFNEVFLTEVWIPDDHRLGAVHDGWRVALTTLMNERAAVGAGGAGGAGVLSTKRLVALARHCGVADDPVIRQTIADLHTRLSVARYSRLRAEARRRAGQPPGPEMSTAKLALTENLARLSAFVTAVLGPRLIADTGEWGTYAWAEFVLGVPGLRLGGGTDEIQRNIVAERVLGLPRDPAS
ncbi:MAG TPA: acyl-CoA dehydrogenase family protein [Acidimicrobiia bacterium]|nr:acyl-CoA dehydrogenase family protein [Acidimicrobiia bacterium]